MLAITRLSIAVIMCSWVLTKSEGQGPPIDTQGTPLIVGTEDRSQWAVRDEVEAIRHTEQLLGLPVAATLPSQSRLITLAQDNTPFLSEKVVGRSVWHVVVGEFKLTVESNGVKSEDQYTRTFDVLLDPRNGASIRVSSRLPDGVHPLPREATATVATEQLMNRGDERYHSFVGGSPQISFYEALASLYENEVNPLEAKIIVAQFVSWSMMGREPKDVWAVTLRGIHPMRSAYDNVPAEARNHMRYIVDPKIRNWICGTTTPQPELESSLKTIIDGQDSP